MYFDEANDRIAVEYRERIEQVRAGYILARDKKAYAKWQQSAPRTSRRGLVGAALEAAVMGVARLFPDNVQRVPA